MIFKDTHIGQGYTRTRRWYVILSATLFLIHYLGVQPSENWQDIRVLTLDLGDAARPMWLYWMLWVVLGWLSYVYWTFYNAHNREGIEEHINNEILPRYFSTYVSNLHNNEIKEFLLTHQEGVWAPQVNIRDQSFDQWQYTLTMTEISESGQSEHIADGSVGRPQISVLRDTATRATNIQLPYMWELRFPFIMAGLALAMAVIDGAILRNWATIVDWSQKVLFG